MTSARLRIAASLVALAPAWTLAAESKLPLQLVADVPLSGGATRFDYMSLDPQTRRLFIAHLGDSTLTVFDLETRRVLADIAGIGHVHGVLAVPELGRVYATATRSDEVVAIDAHTLKIVARMPGGFYPDGLAYAPGPKRLFVSDEAGATETVIDTTRQERIATLHLWSVVGNSQYDPVSQHVFVAAQTRDRLLEIDPADARVVASHALPGADGPHGVLIEPQARLAFIACEGNDRLVVFDLATHEVRADFALGHDPDVLAYDAGLARLYVAAESGVVSAFELREGALRALGQGFVGPKAHTVAVDAQTHLVYFPIENVDGKPLLRILRPLP